MDNMDSINELNKAINNLRMQILDFMYNETRRCASLDTMKLTHIERLRTSIDELTRQRNREIKRIFIPNNKNRPVTSRPRPHRIEHILTHPKLKISTIIIGKHSTIFKMTPNWFKCDDELQALKNIIYPDGITIQRPFNTIARYRMFINKSNNFNQHPLIINENSTETLILALDSFIQQFDGKLSFTNDNLSFETSTYSTASGIANLGSTHLLANQYISSAKFTLLVDINYDELAKSEEKMQNFILNFVDAIAKDLSCENNFIRVIFVEKSIRAKGKIEVNLILTTPDREKTEELADILKNHARSGFVNNSILRHITPNEY